MNDSEFAALADAALHEIEAALDDDALDVETTGDGVLEIKCADGRWLIVNRHDAAREIWVAARAGGFHYRWDGARWRDTRTGDELVATIARLVVGDTAHATAASHP